MNKDTNEKYLADYEFLPNKDTFKKTFKHYRKDINNFDITFLADELFVTSDTIRKWENGTNFPNDLLLLNRIATDYFDITLEDLIIPDAKFKMLNHRNLILYNYNYFWYLLEKNISTFLGPMEKKYIILNSGNLNVKINESNFSSNGLPFDYVEKYCDQVINEYQNDKDMTLKTREEILYKLRTNIIVLYFADILQLFINKPNVLNENIEFLSKFDKIIFFTLIYNYDKFNCLEINKKHNKKDFKILQFDDFHFTNDIKNDYISLINYLQQIDLDLFKKHLLVVRGDDNE